MTRKYGFSVIVLYSPVEPTGGSSIDSDRFYLGQLLHEQMDKILGRVMVFLLGNFNVQFCVWKQGWMGSNFPGTVEHSARV